MRHQMKRHEIYEAKNAYEQKIRSKWSRAVIEWIQNKNEIAWSLKQSKAKQGKTKLNRTEQRERNEKSNGILRNKQSHAQKIHQMKKNKMIILIYPENV